jgi:hypothetical protein
MRKLPDNVKMLRSTLKPPRDRPVRPAGVMPLSRAIQPPKDCTDAEAIAWREHMSAIVAAGRTSACDLLAFRSCVRAAVNADVARELAPEIGLVEKAADGGSKVSAAFRASMLAEAQYRAWLVQLGLSPRARGAVQPLRQRAHD